MVTRIAAGATPDAYSQSEFDTDKADAESAKEQALKAAGEVYATAHAAADSDADWKDATADAFQQFQQAVAEAQAAVAAQMEGRWEQARTDLAQAFVDAAQSLFDDGYRQDLAEELALARQGLAIVLAQNQSDRLILAAEHQLAGDLAKAESEFSHIKPIGPDDFWDKSVLGQALRGAANFLVGAANFLVGGWHFLQINHGDTIYWWCLQLRLIPRLSFAEGVNSCPIETWR